MNPEKITPNQHDYRIQAVFKVFLFRDDVTIQLAPSPADQQWETLLHIKSTSRKGYSDLGVNRRRISTFLKKVQQMLT